MKKTLSILFATLMLFSNMGFSIASHYCQGNLVKTGLVHGGNNFGCCMAKKAVQSPENCDSLNIQKKKNCCQNTYQQLDIEDDFNTQSLQIELNKQFVLAFFPIFFHLTQSEEKEIDTCTAYSPPLIERNTQVLFQTFLL
jgi:hypothetical protein